MSYIFKNTTHEKMRIIIEPHWDSFYLEVDEQVVITVDDNTPIDIDIDTETEGYKEEGITVLCMNSHFHYNREIKKIKKLF